MIIHYCLVFLITTVSRVKTQYLLEEYASKHDNYEPAHYSFAYGVSDPHTGDHKHHWETREGDNVKGEYGLLEPDGATRIVQYTSDPHHGFQAIVRRLHIPPEQYTSGHLLYGIRHAGPYNTNSEQQSQSENADQAAQSPDHDTNTQYEDASSENAYVKVGDVLDCVKQIVKKNNAETHFNYPSSNGEIQSAANEQQEVQSVAPKKDNFQTRITGYYLPDRYAQPVYQPKADNAQQYTNTMPYVIQNIPNAVPINRRTFEEFPTQNIQLLNNYNAEQYLPNVFQNLNKPQIAPGFSQEHQISLDASLGVYNGNPGVVFGGKILNQQQRLPTHINQNQQVPLSISSPQDTQQKPRKNLAQQNDFPVILVDPNAHFGYPFYPHTQVNGLFQIDNGQSFGYEGIPLANGNQNNQQDVFPNNEGRINNDDLKTAQDNQNIQRRIDNNYNNDASASNSVPSGTTTLNEKNSLPSAIYNFQFPDFRSVPQNKKFTSGHQDASIENIFSSTSQKYPPGSTRETIWNAGDETANREVEILVRQLNETCAYFRFNETTPGTEDGTKPNIFNAGDYSAQREETELIRSVNVTCDNFTTDALNNFTSGITIAQYCSQCSLNHSESYEQNKNQPDNYLNNFNIPTNFDNNFWIPPNIFAQEYVNPQPALSTPIPFYYENLGQGQGERIYKRSRVKRYEESQTDTRKM